MLGITESTSAAQAISYHTKDQARENYYSNGQELPGRWGGKGAERLGLSGLVTTADFERLCYNINPATGEALTPRMKANRRVGYDFTFSAPKSVSLVYEWHKDERILQAFDRAVEKTMKIVEDQAATRVRTGGRDEDRITGELLWTNFDHFTARPEDGVPDPQMHRHCYVFNATYDKVEDRWKAAQFGDIKADGEYYQSIWLSAFSKELANLGYDIVPTGKFFEIAGISRSLIEKFSKRSHTIQTKAEELGMTDKAEIAKLGVMTREKKVTDLSREELHALWWARLTPEDERQLNAAGRQLEISPSLERKANIPGYGVEMGGMAEITEPSKADLQAVKFAVEHLFERRSVVYERELIAEALQWGYGKATLPGVTATIKDWTFIRGQKQGQTLLTTKRVQAEENRIVERCRQGKNTLPAIKMDWEILDERLSMQQRQAVQHILRSNDWITGIVGKSGAGKTTALQQAAQGIRAAGKKLIALAPTANASRGSLREAGFQEAETVNKFLMSPRLQDEARGAVLFVDEGGLLSTRITDELLALADKLYARVVLIGDPGQHHSVERGDAFRLLQEIGNMSVVTVDEIQRQKGDYKRAVELISEHNFPDAFKVLEKMGALHEMPLYEREAALAKRYVEILNNGRTAQVISPTHSECERVTQSIRQSLKENGELGDGKKCAILRNLSWTVAQRRDARSYEKGQVVQINQHLDGFSLGERAEVVKVTDGKVEVRGKNAIKSLPLANPDAFGVYAKDSIEICEGERIRITSNGRTEDRHRMNNGDRFKVKEITPEGEIILSNGWQLGRDFAHLEYGYASTSHASQGKTVDYVLVAQSALYSMGASDANQFYVSVSRGRLGVEVFTDSIEVLRENVARVRERPLAMEMGKEDRAQVEDRISWQLGDRSEANDLNFAEFKKHRQEERENTRLVEQFGSLGAEKMNWGIEDALKNELVPEMGKEPEKELELEID